MRRLTEISLRHRRAVFLLWVLIFVAGGAIAGGLQNRLSIDFSLPGQPAFETNQVITARYGNGGGETPAVVTVRLPAGQRADSPAVTAALRTGGQALRDPALAAVPRRPGAQGPPTRPWRVVSYADTRDPALVSADGRTTFLLVFTPRAGRVAADPVKAAAGVLDRQAALPPGTQVRVTGLTQLRESGDSGGGSGVLIETVLGALGGLLVLAFVFGSFIALVPMLVAAVSILTTFLLVDLITTVTEVSFIVQFLVSLIGLGVAIDYSLLTVTRWREERAHGRSNDEAVVVAMETAGKAVVFSGITVAVGLFSLVFLPVPFLRSVGYGGVLIPLVSVVVSSTLLPVILSKAGPFLDRPRIRRGESSSRPWSAWARFVVRRRWAAALVALGLLAALLIPAFGLKVGDPTSSSLASAGPAYEGLETIERAGLPTGVLTPVEVLDETGDGSAVVAATKGLPGVLTSVVSGTQPGAVTVAVLPRDETSTAPAVIDRVRRALPAGARIGGLGAESQDFNKAVYGSFPLMLAIIVVATFLLLVRAFRSVLLPLKAVILNVVSVGATYGAVVLVWQQGHGSQAIWGISATGAVTNFIPLMVFAFLFGLSMDYEVFILARMREEYDATGSTQTAVVEGLSRTGRLVTCAALILFLSFLSLSQAPSTDLKIFATGLGAGILLDATIVRALLVPALVSLFGRWNWWLPAWLARPLRLQPSAATIEVPRQRAPRAETPAPVG